ncbi:unnamed protein product [Paramecium pentaurelia]|uniref:Uncharacterized protein n=1 Tax=Paramecium pentaurelia TaxID=43138 RepID=A0A8S1X7K3_9CILI|nr:unnamed protein product [Paramecium pentaurelia]
MGCSAQKQSIKQELFVSKLNDKEIIEIRDKILKEDQRFQSINTNNFQVSIIQDDGIYTGEVKIKKKDGVGEYISYIDGNNSEMLNKKVKEYYLGQWKNEMKDGYGLMVYYNGNQYDYYVGEFQQDKRHGQGYIKYSNKQQYKGQFENDFFQGKGIYTLQDQDTYYEGEWIQNERDGLGKEQGKDDNKTWQYEGYFSKGKRQGKGKLIIDKEYEIEGDYENDFPKNVIITYKQQEFQDYKYEGYLAINDKQEAIFEGTGKLTMKNNQILEGEFTQHQYKKQEVQEK